jgi:hypothetical protein
MAGLARKFIGWHGLLLFLEGMPAAEHGSHLETTKTSYYTISAKQVLVRVQERRIGVAMGCWACFVKP